MNNSVKVVGLGAGGHARTVIDILKQDRAVEIVGLLSPDSAVGETVLGIAVLGGDELLTGLADRGVTHAFLGVGSTGLPSLRCRLFDSVMNARLSFMGAIHPSAVIAESITSGEGVVVAAGAIIGPCSTIGSNVIVNSGAIVEHDCIVQDHAHIATGAALAGGVRVGARSHVGLGASVLEGRTIGRDAIVGAGAVVTTDVPDGFLVLGIPAKPVRRTERA